MTSSSSGKIVILLICCSFVLIFGNNLLTANNTCDKNCLFNSIILDLELALDVNGFILLSNTQLILFIRFLLELFI